MAKVTATSRLLLVLQHIAAEAGRHPGGAALSVVLQSYVGVPREDFDKDPVRPHLLYARVVRLCVDAIEEVEQCLDDPTLPEAEREGVRSQASQPLKNVLQMFTSQGVVRPASAFLSPDIGAILALSLATQRQIGGEAATAEQLARIQVVITALRELIAKTDMPSALAARFHRILRSLSTAIDEYRYFGADEALACLGAFMGVAAAGRSQMDSEGQSKVLEEFGNLVNLVGALDASYRVAAFALSAAPVVKLLMQ